MSYIGATGTISSFQRKKYDIFYWKINEFSTVSERAIQDSYYICSRFQFKDMKECWLRFYPNGASGKSGIIGLSLISDVHKTGSWVYLTLGLETQSGRIEKWFSDYIFFPDTERFCTSAFTPQSEFLKRKEELVAHDCLTFVVCLSVDAHNIIRDVEDQIETDHAEENGKEEKKGGEKVLGDMAKLLASGDRSDAIIVVEESEYKVHSCILSVRTPVFAALFEHDTLEKATRKITITDCEPDIFAEFLHYIYAGSVQNLSAENAVGLYTVSDKYLIKDLKEVCREHIRDNLCVETFCETVQLALHYKDGVLLDSAFEYFEINFRRIIRSVEWQRYIKENPIEANEIFIRSFGPP